MNDYLRDKSGRAYAQCICSGRSDDKIYPGCPVHDEQAAAEFHKKNDLPTRAIAPSPLVDEIRRVFEEHQVHNSAGSHWICKCGRFFDNEQLRQHHSSLIAALVEKRIAERDGLWVDRIEDICHFGVCPPETMEHTIPQLLEWRDHQVAAERERVLAVVAQVAGGVVTQYDYFPVSAKEWLMAIIKEKLNAAAPLSEKVK